MKVPLSFFKYSSLLVAIALAVMLLGPATASANLPTSPFESSDGNLTVEGSQDWANAPALATGIDLPTGQNDNSFGQGAKEDIPGPTVVSGSIPNNKSDLTRFYVANQFVQSNNFLYLAWERANTLGTANIDFEFNQSGALDSNGATRVRTAGDILITFDFDQGGIKPTLGLLKWLTSGSANQCFANNSLPCWGKRVDLSGAGFADGAVNTSSVPEPIAGGTLDQLTFGESAINLTAAGIFPANQCVHFGSAFVKSRSSTSFTAELKDFIAPIPVNIQNCATVNIHKVDDSTPPVPLQGAVFTLYKNGAPTGSPCTTDSAGNCSLVNILPGQYSVVETTTPPNYTTAPSQIITLVSGQVAALTFTDPRKPATINIHKVDDAGKALAGATFTLFNSGVATSFSCTTDSNGNCTILNILPVGTYTVRETTTPAGYLAAADQTVTLTLNQTVNLTFTDILAKPQLLLVKSATPTAYSTVGTVINYSYVLKNIGNVPLSGPFTVNDNKTGVSCPNTPTTLALNASLTCTASYLITQADLDAGSVTNTATGHAKYGTTFVDSNQDSKTVTATQAPVLSLVKTLKSNADEDKSGTVSLNDTLTFQFVATNSGNVTLGSVTISDPLSGLSSLACTPAQPASLAPGATLTCTATYKVTQADVDAGKISNTATARSNKTPPTTSTVETPVPQKPSLSLVKTLKSNADEDGSHTVSLNDTLTFSFVAINSGNVTLGSVTISDPLSGLSSLTCTPAQPASLAPGDALICTATYKVTQADVDAAKISNTATATSNKTPPATSTIVTPVPQNPALSLTKTANPTTYSAVGDVIAYSYGVKNTGNVTLSGPFAVSDNKTTVNCSSAPATLAPNASFTCTASYTITQADLNAGSVTNIATASVTFNGKTVNSNPATATVTTNQAPALSLTKSASPTTYSAVGTVIAYSYGVKNTGNVTLSGPFTVSDNKTTVTCSGAPATLAPNASFTCTASYTITQNDLDVGSVTNIATASVIFNGKTVNSNPATATVNANQAPALSLTKTATPLTYSKVGDVINYSYVVLNTGNVTLSGPITVSDNKTTVSCPGTSSLAPIASLTCSASYTITQADLSAGSVTNTATASGTFNGKPVNSNTATAKVNALLASLCVLVYNDLNGNGTRDVGEPLLAGAQITVKNSSNVNVGTYTTNGSSEPYCFANLPAGWYQAAELNPSGYTSTTSDIVAVQLSAGAATNVVYGDWQNPMLSLTKTATPTTYSAVGDVINYSYVVLNTGNVTLSSPITVTDNKTAVTCPGTSSLAPTASLTCTASYTITQADLDAGSVTNIATASTTFNGKPVNSNQAQATVTRATWTGKITPTQTTCQMYTSGTAADLTQLLYGVKSGKINNVAPGVFFYYTTLKAPSTSLFTINIAQTKSATTTTIPFFGVQQNNQVSLYNADCSTSNLGRVTVTGGQVQIAITGATVGQNYIVGIKYDSGTVVGAQTPSPTTVHYDLATRIGSIVVDKDIDGLDLKLK
jgi:uncharacterized repeat protein (TIGR01451 family)